MTIYTKQVGANIYDGEWHCKLLQTILTVVVINYIITVTFSLKESITDNAIKIKYWLYVQKLIMERLYKVRMEKPTIPVG